MIRTYSTLGVVCFGLVAAACGDQKDPNAPVETTDETSDETSDDETSSNNSSTSEPQVNPDTTDTSASSDSDAGADTSSTTDTSDLPTSTDSSSDETSEGPTPVADQICPMVVGATWTYKHSDWTEIQTVTATEHDGEAAFLVTDTPDPEDDFRADSVHVKRDGRLLRVAKDQIWVNPNNGTETPDSSATYGVGFLRCDEAWVSKEAGWSESPGYVRVETVAGEEPKPAEERKHTFTIEGRENLSTSDGKTYNNCVKVRRSKDWAAVDSAEDAQEKLYWFCPGVGKVREENVESGNFEELTAYSIPE